MTIEVRPLGVTCNIQCQYCYQNPMRDTGNTNPEYDLELLMTKLEQEDQKLQLFGGEALLLPIEHLERLLDWGYQRFGSSAIQTNGTLITAQHIELFIKYNVSVGISVDGPGQLNNLRWAGSAEKTKQLTQKTHSAIEQLCKIGRVPALIVTLHRFNATQENLPLMRDWFRHLDGLGVTSVRLHILENENEYMRSKYSLSAEENFNALKFFYHLENELSHLRFDLFHEMKQLLLGRDDKATCVWNGCDPYTTRAVRGLEGDGHVSNCSRTNKDGINFVKAETGGYERYMALYNTPQEYSGCKGCRFFLMCKGQCPGTAVDGDWRNRSEYCEVWKHLFELFETELIEQKQVPLSTYSHREDLELLLYKRWQFGENDVSLVELVGLLEATSA